MTSAQNCLKLDSPSPSIHNFRLISNFKNPYVRNLTLPGLGYFEQPVPGAYVRNLTLPGLGYFEQPVPGGRA